MSVTAEQALTVHKARELYARDGFVAVPPLLPPEFVAEANERMDVVMSGEYETGHEPLNRNWSPGDDPTRLVKIDEPQWSDRRLAEIISHPAIGRWAADLYGADEIYVWACQLLYKPPGGTSAGNVGWHQDDDYWKDWWDGDVFTCWLALSDVTPESGAMTFVPGSHEWGFLASGNFFEVDIDNQKSGYKVPEGSEWNEVVASLPPGAATFHHRDTLHGSGPNLTDQPRRSLAIHLRTGDARSLPGSGFKEATKHSPIGELKIDF